MVVTRGERKWEESKVGKGEKWEIHGNGRKLNFWWEACSIQMLNYNLVHLKII